MKRIYIKLPTASRPNYLLILGLAVYCVSGFDGTVSFVAVKAANSTAALVFELLDSVGPQTFRLAALQAALPIRGSPYFDTFSGVTCLHQDLATDGRFSASYSSALW